MGFLNKQSLRMVWSASRCYQDYRSLHFPGIISSSTNLQFTQSGRLRRIVIAAKFNATAHVGWPKLQIMRINVERDAYDIVASTTNTTEPRPTGYLNVYEYELNNSVTVEIDDMLAISCCGNVSQRDQIRYSLAYYNSSGSRVPMVSITVGTETDRQTSNTLQCEEMNITTTSDSPGPSNTISIPAIDNEQMTSINQMVNSESEVTTRLDKTIIISGTVVFSPFINYSSNFCGCIDLCCKTKKEICLCEFH